MKASKLIEELTELVKKAGDVEVDINNSHGSYSKIFGVKLAMWTDSKRKLHKVIEIMHTDSYDPSESIVEEK